MLRLNEIDVCGCIKWKDSEIREVSFQNGETKRLYRILISCMRSEKKDSKIFYDRIYVELANNDAAYVQKYLNIDDFIYIKGECSTKTMKKSENGVTSYSETCIVKAKSITTAKGLQYNQNRVVLMGYLAKDPVSFPTANSKTALMTVMVNRVGGQNVDTFSVRTFGWTAEDVMKYYHKGDPVAVVGLLQTAYLKDGNWCNKAEIIAESVKCPIRKNAAKSVPTQVPEQDVQPNISPEKQSLADFEDDIFKNYNIDFDSLENPF